MMSITLEDARIMHAVKDLHRAVEDDRFEVETPRVSLTQDDFDTLSIGWSRDRKFTRSHTNSPGPKQVDVQFDTPLTEELYNDIEDDMNTVEPNVVLYGQMHLWYGYIPHHTMNMGVTVEDGATLSADLHWLNVDVAGWRF